jgi:hypothetical protein
MRPESFMTLSSFQNLARDLASPTGPFAVVVTFLGGRLSKLGTIVFAENRRLFGALLRFVTLAPERNSGSSCQNSFGFCAASVVLLLGCRSSVDAPTPRPDTVPAATATASVPILSTPPSAASASASSEGPKRYAFDFEDADLPELVRLISTITGKRFLYTGSIPHLHATSRSPQPVTADEAYAAFLTILQANGLTVVARGNVNEIIASATLINR